ncbi:hypothetical protein JY651_14560 [Pyxidicoccus parkwayensis]|uniref:Transporter n=1 Tax=Pyxidicoccus parkwayensis TaxID=2813578 RepID=A0ABX7P6N9_9BACT|nr:hypothetical protein [Pyxidicoccus parkwaysis]QSQ26067.1 hypothetical protein JY651_14560 [Pyxidicoccus parkwaysis]
MKPHSALSLLTLSLCLGFSAPVLAQQTEADAPLTPQSPTGPVPPALAPVPNVRLYLASLSLVRYNPLGLETQNRLMLQKRLFDSESMLLRDTFIGGGLSLKANPAGVKVGPLVEFQPVAMFNLRAGYEYSSYFGTLGFLQSYPNSLADFSDDARDLTEDSAYSTSGHHFFVEPTLQGKVRNFVLRTKFGIEYWNVALREGGNGTFYDALLDTLVPGKGWVFTNDTDLLMLASRQWTVGLRFSAVMPRYGQAEGVTVGNNSHMRIGPMAAYSLNTSEGTLFNKPTLLLITGWYLKHPSRVEAMPYVLGAFAFSSDLLGGD